MHTRLMKGDPPPRGYHAIHLGLVRYLHSFTLSPPLVL